MSREDVERALSQYLSRHHYPRSGLEAYDFNIKMGLIDVPSKVREHYSEAEVNDRLEAEMVVRLKDFGEYLTEDFPWIRGWLQEGRSGGWLVVETDDPMLNDDLEVNHLGRARKRVRELRQISIRIREEQLGLEGDIESLEWWGIPSSVKDWSPKDRP